MSEPTTPTIEPMNTIQTSVPVSHSVEFFHIYTDEKIDDRHIAGLEYFKAAKETWSFNYQAIVLIDNYNPTTHILSAEQVMDFLASQKMLPSYWAYEADMVNNAKVLLENLTDHKLKNNYLRYIEKKGKYPCSLLTATWYLTRLGRFDSQGIIKSLTPGEEYKPAKYLVNFLPQDYKDIEKRAFELIRKSNFSKDLDNIQDLFYPIDSGRKLDIF